MHLFSPIRYGLNSRIAWKVFSCQTNKKKDITKFTTVGEGNGKLLEINYSKIDLFFLKLTLKQNEISRTVSKRKIVFNDFSGQMQRMFKKKHGERSHLYKNHMRKE